MQLEAARVFAVIALVCTAACLATPPGRIPLALRGIRRMLDRDFGGTVPEAGKKAPLWRRLAAFILVLAAAALCF